MGSHQKEKREINGQADCLQFPIVIGHKSLLQNTDLYNPLSSLSHTWCITLKVCGFGCQIDGWVGQV